jgi:hypothetical protein
MLKSESDRQFDVELFIMHPTIDPSEIAAALGLEAARSHRVGDRRMTPPGTLREGNYPDTRWRHSARYTTSHQRFADKVESLEVKVLPKRAFLSRVLQTRGRLSLIVQFLGDGYFGDTIPRSTLAKIADLGCRSSSGSRPSRALPKYFPMPGLRPPPFPCSYARGIPCPALQVNILLT